MSKSNAKKVSGNIDIDLFALLEDSSLLLQDDENIDERIWLDMSADCKEIGVFDDSGCCLNEFDAGDRIEWLKMYRYYGIDLKAI